MSSSSQVLAEALRRVANGEHSFSPDEKSPEALFGFQPLAQALVAAGEAGLVHGVSAPRSKRRARHGMILMVTVGYLTPAGAEQLLVLSRGPVGRFFAFVSSHSWPIIVGIIIAVLGGLAKVVLGV